MGRDALIRCQNREMFDSSQHADRAVADADFLEWNFSVMARSSPWSVEIGMTQLLAHENAEGFGPPLADAVRGDARVIHELGRRRTPTAVAALRAFQAMSTVDTQRELAAMNADRLVKEGLPEPPWADTIGRVRVDGCWWTHDRFGETAVVLCAFSYDGADEHTIFAMIDRTLGGGLFRELLAGSDTDLLHRFTEDGDEFVTAPLEPAYARRLLEDAFETSDELIENRQYKPKPVPAAYRKMRALTLARARALSAVPAPPEPFPSSVEIELLKRTFLASGAATSLPADEVTKRAVDLLVTHFVEMAACHPVHLGPRQIMAVLGLPSLTADAVDDPDLTRILPDVAHAWVCWTAAERGLPSDATEQLENVARQACAELRAGGPGSAGGPGGRGGQRP